MFPYVTIRAVNKPGLALDCYAKKSQRPIRRSFQGYSIRGYWFIGYIYLVVINCIIPRCLKYSLDYKGGRLRIMLAVNLFTRSQHVNKPRQYLYNTQYRFDMCGML